MEHTLSLDEIIERLAQAGPSPLNEGRLEMIVRRPAVEQREVLEQAELSEIEGLIGDNWRVRGSHSTLDGRAHPDAQVTLMNSRVIQALSHDRSGWAQAGDQLFVDLDLSDENLPAGQRIAIGSAILEITAKPHTGCAKFSSRFGSGAIHFVNSPEGRRDRRRGVNARVVQAGVIRLGDTARKIKE